MAIIRNMSKTNADEDVEKKEPSYTAGGSSSQYNHSGKQCGVFLKN
jgi:hypothetical protein